MLTRNDGLLDGVGLVSPFAMMDELRREMDRMFEGVERSMGHPSARRLAGAFDGRPDVELSDEGDRFVVRAEVPGVKESDLEVTYDRGTVSIRARRDASIPEGWSVHRKERASYELSRVITLPSAIDADQASAALRHGMLEVVLPKTPEAQPKRLTVRSSETN